MRKRSGRTRGIFACTGAGRNRQHNVNGFAVFPFRCSVERVGGSRPLEIVHTGTFCTSYPPSFVRVLRLFKTSFVINFVVV